MLTILGVIFIIAAVVCWLIILVDAFKNAVWKGIVGFLCGLYLLYYAIAEFQHDNKWLIVLVWLFGGGIGGALMSASGVLHAGH